MGSFTDLIPKFNPYIQQLPVEAMVAVGMDKQRRYEEGVQRIQAQIDQVAGMSVLRPVDKQYLQSKLNELGGNLKGVAAGDFSNFQLVNSVGGMVSQISKDPVINAAVRSAQVDRENRELMEKERASGKLTPQNEHFYNLQRKKYLDAGLKDESGQPVVFSGRYVAYRDVKAKMKELAKEVGVDESIVQNMYNADGTLNKVMIETLTKGKDANKLYDAFMNGLGPEDYQQLAIDGIYKYRGNDAASMIDIFKASNDDFVATGSSKLADIKTQIHDLTIKKATVKTPEELEQLKKQISSLEGLSYKISDSILQSNNTFDDLKRNINFGDEDYLNGVKGKLYTNNFLKSLSKDFAESTSHVKVVENPLYKVLMEENKFAIDTWYKKEQLKIDWAKLAESKEANRLKAREIQLKEKAGLPLTAPTDAGVPSSEISISDKVITDHLKNMENRSGQLQELAKRNMRALYGSGMEAELEKQIKASGKTKEKFLEDWGVTVLSEINTGKRKASSQDENLLTNINNLNKIVSATQSEIERADAEAKVRAGSKGIDEVNILKSAKPMTVQFGRDVVGKTHPDITLQPADQLDLVKASRGSTSSESEKAQMQMSRQRLRNKFGEDGYKRLVAWAVATDLYNPGTSWWRKTLEAIPQTIESAALLSGGPSGVAQYMSSSVEGLSSFQKMLNQYTSDEYRSFKREQEDVYKNRFKSYLPINESVIMDKDSRDIFKAKLSALFGQRPEFPKILENLNKDGSQTFLTTTPPIAGIALGGSPEISLTVIPGKGEESIPPIIMSPEQYAYLTGKIPAEVDPRIAVASALVNGSPDKSSNKYGVGTVETAFFSSSSFKNLKDFKINGGDFIQDATGAPVFYPKVYYTPKGASSPITVDFGVGLSLVDVMRFPDVLTDAKFRQAINLQ